VGEKALRNDLRVARARFGLTQAALAEAVGVTRKTINSIENGRYIPSTHLALLLARVLETTVESLFQLPSGTDESRETVRS
jgi:putative transcriptional regulator